MRKVTIQRKTQNDLGTFGELSIEGSDFKCCTGELPWRDNVRTLSCIRAGVYEVHWSFSPGHHRQIYELQDVPCRTDVQIHAGNFCGDIDKGLKRDVEGCIILGDEVGAIEGQKAVLHSKKTVQAFENEMDCQPFMLTIYDVRPEEAI